jgi:hypothetical protein
LEGTAESSFKKSGKAVTWGKCAGIVAGAALFALIPQIGVWLMPVAAFAGIMVGFQKSFLQTLLILVVCVVIQSVLAPFFGLLVFLSLPSSRVFGNG